MSDFAIKVEGLSKKYLLGVRSARPEVSLREQLTSGLVRTVHEFRGGLSGRRSRMLRNPQEEFWALRDVNFQVQSGEILGVMGRNGAGKSTLLRVLSRITDPTEGRIAITGRVASLLEVGTGFHPELTGRENIYLNGAILGMRRSEVRAKFDQIVAFAEVSQFVDTPVKRYSSGMYMRLAFAVAAHLESDILVVDEVLAVGDAEFQKKCLGRMGEVSRSGRTVLFVSHSVGALLAVCQTGLVLDKGRVLARAPIKEAADAYRRLGEVSGYGLDSSAFSGPLKNVIFSTLELNGQRVVTQCAATPSDDLIFEVSGRATASVPNYRFGFSLSRDGVRIFTVHDAPQRLEPGTFSIQIRIPAQLLRPGDFMISFGGRRVDGDEWVWGNDVASVTISEAWSGGYEQDNIGIINLATGLTRIVKPEVARAAEVIRTT